MRAFVVLVLFIAIPLASGALGPIRDAEYWRESGFNLAQVRPFFSNTICRKNETLFNACRQAFLQGARLLDRVDIAKVKALRWQTSADFDFEAQLAQLDQAAAAPSVGVPKELVYGAMVNALLRQFDDHALLVPLSYLSDLTANSTQQVMDLGIEKEISDAGLFVRRVYPHTPAQAAGLQVNDRIVEIQGLTVEPGRKALIAVGKLAQAPGKGVDLTIERHGMREKVTVAVGRLALDSVTAEVVSYDGDNVAVVTLRSFNHGVCALMRSELQVLAAHKVKAAILDLRFNPGGIVDEAACVLTLFSRDGLLVSKRPIKTALPAELPLALNFPGGEAIRAEETGAPVFPTQPLVVLVNAATASAAEMLASALQDQGRAWIVGEVTFGKGSTQAVVGQSFNSKLRLVYTVSRYYRPSGSPLQLIGLTPDFVEPFRAQSPAAERVFLREGELFGTKLMPEPARPWTQSRVGRLKAIQNCVQGRRLDKDAASWLESMLGYEDHQKAYAFGVLHCL